MICSKPLLLSDFIGFSVVGSCWSLTRSTGYLNSAEVPFGPIGSTLATTCVATCALHPTSSAPAKPAAKTPNARVKNLLISQPALQRQLYRGSSTRTRIGGPGALLASPAVSRYPAMGVRLERRSAPGYCLKHFSRCHLSNAG